MDFDNTSNSEPVVVAVSGYFIYPHVGHIRLFEHAKKLGDKLVVIVNNDLQQKMKYGKIIVPEKDRLEVVRSIRFVDEAFLSVDDDRTICKSLEKLRPNIFANGGDRNSGEIPESKICDRCGIKMIDNVGGVKIDSSSRIIKEIS